LRISPPMFLEERIQRQHSLMALRLQLTLVMLEENRTWTCSWPTHSLPTSYHSLSDR
jgi:hypothetical protein